ncbi:MAG TPA: ubiquinol oxidase subunit II [Stellaceae bacterium]|nr:ubiquinol oxidase subunit II [Stellaceae bacterium]
MALPMEHLPELGHWPERQPFAQRSRATAVGAADRRSGTAWRSGSLGPGLPRRLRLVAALLLPPLAGCSGGVLDPQGPVGAADVTIMLDALAIMLVIGIPTIVAALAFAWWFRPSNKKARYLPDWTYSGRIELVVWAIPLLTILFLGGLIWVGAHQLDPYEPLATQGQPGDKPIEVQVVSLDWKWLFIYPEQRIASVNELVVPVATPVHFSLTSASVMNSFFVPQLGTMIATMNRMVTQLYLEASHVGDYYGLSTQFSGDGFSDMHFYLHAVPKEAFEQWVAKVQQAGPVLDRAGYAQLLDESRPIRPFTYKSVEPNLFDQIATDQIPPGPGLETEGPPSRRRVPQ